MYTPILEYRVLEYRVLRIHPSISTLLQDLKLTKHWFSSFQWGPLSMGMNEIFATLRPPITIFLMTGTLSIRHICNAYVTEPPCIVNCLEK